MEKRLLECGHTAAIEPGATVTWCPIDNEPTLVVSEPVHAGDESALARSGR